MSLRALHSAEAYGGTIKSRGTSAPYQVWLLDEGSGGHRVQSEGVVKALKMAGIALEVSRIAVRPRIRGFLRPPARSLFRHLRGGAALTLANVLADFALPETSPPKFIISSGGSTAFASRGLSLWSSAPNIFVGNPKPFPADWFRIVMSPVPLPAIPGAILTEIVPNNVTADECRAAAEQHWGGTIPEKCWTMLIGGANRNHLFSEGDWLAIARGMNRLAQTHGIKWLVTTSRRSGPEAEEIFRSTLRPEAVEELVIQTEDPRPVVMSFLGAGERIFVTQDSLTMLSEAISSGKPVVSLVPARIDLDPDNFMAVMLRQYHGFEQFSAAQSSSFETYEPSREACICNRVAERAMAMAAQRLITELAI